ncbi:hypothetical protein Y032_0156g3140 [Ancylostoma ceylanicum]|uniref:Uncharacterized protein n=1 Tax=Ancylostoma ceylanicum TaxID=53326 RepID=A0A016SZ79_9BILA|nr:hypothetical protein Y032_0156g3140 [Ancylostoma ceylanicum]
MQCLLVGRRKGTTGHSAKIHRTCGSSSVCNADINGIYGCADNQITTSHVVWTLTLIFETFMLLQWSKMTEFKSIRKGFCMKIGQCGSMR